MAEWLRPSIGYVMDLEAMPGFLEQIQLRLRRREILARNALSEVRRFPRNTQGRRRIYH